MHSQHSLTSASVFMFDSLEQYTNIRYTRKEEEEEEEEEEEDWVYFVNFFFQQYILKTFESRLLIISPFQDKSIFSKVYKKKSPKVTKSTKLTSGKGLNPVKKLNCFSFVSSKFLVASSLFYL